MAKDIYRVISIACRFWFWVLVLLDVSNFLISIDSLGDVAKVSKLVASLTDDDFRSARATRLEAANALLDSSSLDGLVLSIGADMPWLCGYEAMPLERLTALVIPRGERPTLVVPELEAPRVRHDEDLFDLLPWKEDDDPFERVLGLVGSAKTLGVSDRMWARSLLELQVRGSGLKYTSASQLLSSLRGHKDEIELLLLARAAHITDDVARSVMSGTVRFEGRSEHEVSDDIADSLISGGLSRVNFAIVGAGVNSASPHHEPGDKKIENGDPVVCDFGGVFSVLGEPGYCSDITRTVVVGDATPEFVDLYRVLLAAQNRARTDATSQMTGREIDALARDEIGRFDFGEFFIHRTGHGIGIEEHEEPYIVSSNDRPVGSYAVFSVEPGIYIPNRFGARIEDICVTGDHGIFSLNQAPRELHSV